MTKELSPAESNAQAWRNEITAAHEAHCFCADEGDGRDLSKEAKACLRQHGYDGINHAEVAELIEETMRESALSVEVREGWKEPGDGASLDPEEFRILLTTGGPALRIRGELNRGTPSRCWLQIQDWGTPWTTVFAKHERECEALMWFAELFWFGE